MLDFRIEELASGGKRLGGGVLILLARRDVLAALDAVGFVGAARDRHGDARLDLGMHGDGHLLLPDRLDRRVEPDLRPADHDAMALQSRDDIPHRNRAEQLSGFGRLADDHEIEAIDLLRGLGCFTLGHQVTRFEFGLHAVVLGAVVGGGAQRLAALQQKIAGKPVPDADDFAHLAELGDALQQNDFHVRSPSDDLAGDLEGRKR